jgi:hypothetical protein
VRNEEELNGLAKNGILLIDHKQLMLERLFLRLVLFGFNQLHVKQLQHGFTQTVAHAFWL